MPKPYTLQLGELHIPSEYYKIPPGDGNSTEIAEQDGHGGQTYRHPPTHFVGTLWLAVFPVALATLLMTEKYRAERSTGSADIGRGVGNLLQHNLSDGGDKLGDSAHLFGVKIWACLQVILRKVLHIQTGLGENSTESSERRHEFSSLES